MIVSCRSCQTRFRIADEKVNDRGVKVRCSRCGEVFVVRRDDEPSAARGDPDVPWEGTPGPATLDEPPPPVTDPPTRVDTPSGFGEEADLGPPAAPPPPPVSDPDLFGNDPFAGVDLAGPIPDGAPAAAVPPPLPTFPRVPAPPPPAPDVVPDDDPFAGLASAPKPLAPSVDPFGLDDMLGKSEQGEKNEGSGLDLDLPEDRAPAPSAPPEPVVTAESRPRAVARLTVPEPPPPSRLDRNQPSGMSTFLSVAAGMLLLLGALAGLVVARGGSLSPAKLSMDVVFHAVGLDPTAGSGRELDALDVVTGLYTTGSGERVLFVRGRVENRAVEARGPVVRITAELLADGGRVLAKADGFAGAAPTVEQIHSIRGENGAEELQRSQGARAEPMAPRSSAPFLVLFTDPPPRLERARVRVSAAAGPRPAPPPEPPPSARPEMASDRPLP